MIVTLNHKSLYLAAVILPLSCRKFKSRVLNAGSQQNKNVKGTDDDSAMI